jgi:hypothetical protein
MNKYYFIAPGILLAAFIGYERHTQRQRSVHDQEEAAQLATARKQQDLLRQRQIAAALKDSAERVAERDQQERDRTGKKRADYDALIATLQSQADAHSAENKKLNEAIHAMAVQVDTMRARQQALDREAAELSRQLEVRQRELRAAELDVQLTTSAVTKRLSEAILP